VQPLHFAAQQSAFAIALDHSAAHSRRCGRNGPVKPAANKPLYEKTRRVESAGLSSDRGMELGGTSAIGQKAIPGWLTNPSPPQPPRVRGASGPHLSFGCTHGYGSFSVKTSDSGLSGFSADPATCSARLTRAASVRLSPASQKKSSDPPAPAGKVIANA
jgi:hypothetical protein